MIRRFFQKKKKVKTPAFEDEEFLEGVGEDYIEVTETYSEEEFGKVYVRPMLLEDFSDVKEMVNLLREGNSILIINIRPLKEKDLVELKRSINKLKKTVEVIEGDIAGFGEDYIIVTPSFAQIYRGAETKEA